MSLRVLHVIPSVAPCRGGPSKAVLEMVTALNTGNIQAEIATTNDSCAETLPVDLTTLSNYAGVPTRFFERFSSSINGLREFQYSSQFKHWLRDHIDDYDLIHVHAIFSYCSTYAMWLARKHKIPYVVRPIGQLENWSLQQKSLKKKLYLSLIEKKNLTAANLIHFTAASEQQQALENLTLRSSTVIPLGIEMPDMVADASRQLHQKYQIGDDVKIIATLSRIHKKKGLELLLNSLAELNTKSFKLLIAGDGDAQYLAELKALVIKLGLEAQVEWLGFVEGKDKNIVLQGSDLFALTSYSENFGISVLEALASGTPALVTRNVALAEQIEQAHLGYICDTTEQSIRLKLTEALQQSATDHRMGQRAREFVSDHFKWSTIASRLTSAYQSILD